MRDTHSRIMILPNPDQLFSVPARGAKQESAAARPETAVPISPDRAELCAVVVRAQAGDLAAQTDLIQRYRRRLAGHIRLIIRQPDAVDDVLQNVFIKMLRRLGRLRDAMAFESWLFRLSRNSALDYIRRQRRRPATIPAEDELHEIPDTSNASATTEIMEALDQALHQLSPTDQNLVRLFVQGHSYRAIAAREGLTAEAVKARLHRTRPFLRASVGHATATRLPCSKRWSSLGGRLAA